MKTKFKRLTVVSMFNFEFLIPFFAFHFHKKWKKKYSSFFVFHFHEKIELLKKININFIFIFTKMVTHYLKVSSSQVPCNPCMESIIPKINFLKNENCIFFAFFKKLKNEFPSNLYFKN